MYVLYHLSNNSKLSLDFCNTIVIIIVDIVEIFKHRLINIFIPFIILIKEIYIINI